MGYRSDVAIALKGNAVDILLQELREHYTDIYKEALPLLASNVKGYIHQTGEILYVFESIKWYDSEPGTIACTINEILLTKINREEYLYMIVGEELEDTQAYGGWWDNPFGLNLHREFTWSK